MFAIVLVLGLIAMLASINILIEPLYNDEDIIEDYDLF